MDPLAKLEIWLSLPVIASIWSIYVFDDNSACNVFVSGITGQWIQQMVVTFFEPTENRKKVGYCKLDQKVNLIQKYVEWMEK